VPARFVSGIPSPGSYCRHYSDSAWPVVFSANGSQLAIADWKNNRITLYDTTTMKEGTALIRPEFDNDIQVLTFSQDSNILAIGAMNAVWLWNLKTHQLQETVAQVY
jgi:WD40 repeat protein